MKMLMLTHTYYPMIGGGIRYKWSIAQYLRSKAHRVDVLAVSPTSHLHFDCSDGGVVVWSPSNTKVADVLVSTSYSYLFRKMISEYDIALFNFPSPMAEMSLLRHAHSAKNVKKVTMYHADIVDSKRFAAPYNYLVTARFLKLMDKIIVSTPPLLRNSRHLRPVQHKTVVIPFGIDHELYFPSPDRSGPDNTSALRFLFVGRLARYKGLDVLLTAMRGAPGLLDIVGDGPLKDQVDRVIETNDLGKRVTLHGRISDERLLQFYQQADVLILPSTDAGEAFGYVIIEAMMTRTAIISTELGTGTSFVNKDGETGLVIPPNDPEALAAAMNFLADHPDELRRLQDNAYRRACSEFSRDRMLSANLELFERLLDD